MLLPGLLPIAISFIAEPTCPKAAQLTRGEALPQVEAFPQLSFPLPKQPPPVKSTKPSQHTEQQQEQQQLTIAKIYQTFTCKIDLNVLDVETFSQSQPLKMGIYFVTPLVQMETLHRKGETCPRTSTMSVAGLELQAMIFVILRTLKILPSP